MKLVALLLMNSKHFELLLLSCYLPLIFLHICVLIIDPLVEPHQCHDVLYRIISIITHHNDTIKIIPLYFLPINSNIAVRVITNNIITMRQMIPMTLMTRGSDIKYIHDVIINE